MKNNSKKSGPESVESTEPELFEKVVHLIVVLRWLREADDLVSQHW